MIMGVRTALYASGVETVVDVTTAQTASIVLDVLTVKCARLVWVLVIVYTVLMQTLQYLSPTDYIRRLHVKLHLIRGLPGAGKSTLADNMEGCWSISADQFFMQGTEYKYDAKFIGNAHDWCLARVIMHLRRGQDVAVANTFTRSKEMGKYIALKDYFPDLSITITEMFTQYGSIHKVPAETIDRMAERWQGIPQEWINSGVAVNTIE